jgi:hypothetical protein
MSEKTPRQIVKSVAASQTTTDGGFDTNGNFHRRENFYKRMLNEEVIAAETVDNEFNNVAEALSQCLLRSGKGKLIDKLDMGGNLVENSGESFDMSRGILGTVKQIMRDPTRVFIDTDTTGECIVLKNIHEEAYFLPETDYDNGTWFILQTNVAKNSTPIKVRWDNVETFLEYDCVDAEGNTILAGVLKQGGIYLVLAKDNKFYFTNVFINDNPTPSSGAIEVFNCGFMKITYSPDDDEKYIDGIQSNFLTESYFEEPITQINSDVLRLYWGLSPGVSNISSPKKTLKVDTTDPQFLKMESNVKFTSKNFTVKIDDSDPANIDLATLTARVECPDATIAVNHRDGITWISYARSLNCPDGTIKVESTAFGDSITAQQLTITSPDGTIDIKRGPNPSPPDPLPPDWVDPYPPDKYGIFIQDPKTYVVEGTGTISVDTKTEEKKTTFTISSYADMIMSSCPEMTITTPKKPLYYAGGLHFIKEKIKEKIEPFILKYSYWMDSSYNNYATVFNESTIINMHVALDENYAIVADQSYAIQTYVAGNTHWVVYDVDYQKREVAGALFSTTEKPGIMILGHYLKWSNIDEMEWKYKEIGFVEICSSQIARLLKEESVVFSYKMYNEGDLNTHALINTMGVHYPFDEA